MKSNFKYVKTLDTRINHKGETVWVYKRVSANQTTWSPSRSAKVIRAIRQSRRIIKSNLKRKKELEKIKEEKKFESWVDEAFDYLYDIKK